MKRIGNLFEKVVDLENLKIADKKARRRKLNTWGVKKHLRNEEENIYNLSMLLKSGDYKTSQYDTFIIKDP